MITSKQQYDCFTFSAKFDIKPYSVGIVSPSHRANSGVTLSSNSTKTQLAESQLTSDLSNFGYAAPYSTNGDYYTNFNAYEALGEYSTPTTAPDAADQTDCITKTQNNICSVP